LKFGDETLINQLVEHSVLPQKPGDLFTVVPVRSFRANGNEVKSLTISASTDGNVSLYDLSGSLIANTTLNTTLGSGLPYQPIQIIKPPTINEILFAVLSDKRIDALKLVLDDPKTKGNRLMHAWSSSLEEAGVKGKAVHSFASR